MQLRQGHRVVSPVSGARDRPQKPVGRDQICRENKTWQDEYNLPEPPPYTNPYQSSWLAVANYEASKKFPMARDLRRNRWSCEILEALGKEMSLETATAKKLPIVPAHVPGELAPNERDVAMAMGNLQEFMIRAGIASQNLLVPYVSSVRDDCNLSAPGGCTIRALGSEMTLEIAYVALRGCAPAPNGASGVDCDFTMKLSCQAADDRTGILCATLGAPNVFDSINFVRQPGGWVARFRG